jgi:ribose transport system substrate-binding protein
MSRLPVVFVFIASVFWCSYLSADQVRFNPDDESSTVKWSRLNEVLGPAPNVRGQRFGVVLKNLTNEYWRLIASGLRRRAATSGAKLDIQAAQSETDPTRQLSIMEMMVGNRYAAILISPQTRTNLDRAIQDASLSKIPIVDLDGDVVDSVANFVGTVNIDIGAKVARWFIRTYPQGGKVAVIQGQAGVFSTIQRTRGFHDTLLATGRFTVAGMASGNWDRQEAYDATIVLLKRAPDLIGIYCNNDVMALGVVDAVKSLKLLDQVHVFGTDGTDDAYLSIRSGELTGTVDTFPMLTGEIGLEVAERLSAGQPIPRVVVSANALVTRENIDRYRVGSEQLRAILNSEEHD